MDQTANRMFPPALRSNRPDSFFKQMCVESNGAASFTLFAACGLPSRDQEEEVIQLWDWGLHCAAPLYSRQCQVSLYSYNIVVAAAAAATAVGNASRISQACSTSCTCIALLECKDMQSIRKSMPCTVSSCRRVLQRIRTSVCPMTAT